MNCEKCGQPVQPGFFCENCGHLAPAAQNPDASQAPITEPQVELKKPENFALGIVGALVGALLGAASIVLFGQMGYVASLSGLILAFCTVKGYELLAKGRSIKGIIVCLVLIAVAPYFADRLNWALTFQKEVFPDVPLSNMFAAIPELLSMYPELAADYWKNLLMTYAFSALGAFGILRGLFTKKK